MSAQRTRPAARRLLAVALALSAGLALSGCSLLDVFTAGNQAVRDGDGQVIEGNEETDVFSLQVGDCLNDGEVGETVTAVPTVPCAEPHDSEIYASYILGDTAFPGIDTIVEEADAACLAGYTEFLGIDYLESRYDFSYYHPTESSWAGGDREILCLVYDPSGEPLTGTLQGAGE
ncbi:MAG: septum formation family protein [Microcella sp.]|uniref:septum formation family protein n=1 Tax=Microcella sp. TaxID=1913979 RepID=UPI00331637B1